MANEVLDIHNLQFVVTSQIDRALHWTMIRELTMNAIEAASQAYGEKIVHWTTGRYEGVRKAVIWNTGPGMRAAELKAATKIACEVNENFGVGAKVSSLANNRVGMRFRSCKDQRVSQVLLGYDQEQKLYVRFEFQLPDGRKDTVIDVTGIAIKEGREVSQDWTEVMLLGNSEDQDTVDRPLATQPTTEKAFVANSIYRRFYRLPPDVKL